MSTQEFTELKQQLSNLDAAQIVELINSIPLYHLSKEQRESILEHIAYNHVSPKLVASMIEGFVNSSSLRQSEVAVRLTRMHRYLQSEFFTLVYDYILILSRNYKQNYYDARNEWACKTANDMTLSIDGPTMEFHMEYLKPVIDNIY